MNRREWLSRALSWSFSGAALGLLGWIFGDVWLAAGRFSTAHWTRVAPAAELERESVIPFPSKKIALIRRRGEVAAISLECTHLGCLLNTLDRGFFCPCHGSEFGPLGEVYSGPAREPLKWHAIRLNQGDLWIHSGEKRDHPQWLKLEA